LLPMATIERNDVERGRYPDPTAERGEPFGKLQPGISLVDAPVDVGSRDRQQGRGAVQGRHPGEYAHRQTRRLAELASKHRLLFLGQGQPAWFWSFGGNRRHGASSGTPSSSSTAVTIIVARASNSRSPSAALARAGSPK